MNPSEEVRLLARPGGRIAYTLQGTGPLVVLAPGMGDLRVSMRELVGPLVDAGHRVAVTDVRGHGDSDPFDEVGDEATASDLAALVEALGGPAVLVGSSFAGSAAVIAAAGRSDLVNGTVLLAPFLREQASPARAAVNRVLYRALLARPWGVRVWRSLFTRSLNRGRQAPWLQAHADAIAASLRRPGRLAQLRRLAVRLDHGVVEPHIDAVRAPALVVVGALDPDFADPAAELAWMGERLPGRTLLVPEAGHYPPAQRPDVVVPAVLDFVGSLGA